MYSKESIKKWEEIGFFFKIQEENKKEILAKLFDDLVIMFKDDENTINFISEETIIFPIVIRIIRSINVEEYDFTNFIDILRKEMLKFHNENNFNSPNISGIDVQAELVNLFCLNFIGNKLVNLLK